MQRLTKLCRDRVKKNDRGASAVIVALMMLPIMIIAALAIDVAVMHADRVQLQTGADAGALAVAQDCARDDCDTAEATAQTMADANFTLGEAHGEIIGSLDEETGKVTVQTNTVREHWFGPIIDIHKTPLQAQSYARWGYPVGGPAVMPVAFSSCELEKQADITVTRDPVTDRVIDVEFNNDPQEDYPIYLTGGESCTGPSGLNIPGGFGWLDPGTEGCGNTLSFTGESVTSDPGASPPSDCTNDDFSKWIGKTVLLPIFEVATDGGNNGLYVIAGYGAFTLTGYDLQGTYKDNTSSNPCPEGRCLRGSFVRFVDLTEDFEYSPSAPEFGAAVVALTPPPPG